MGVAQQQQDQSLVSLLCYRNIWAGTHLFIEMVVHVIQIFVYTTNIHLLIQVHELWHGDLQEPLGILLHMVCKELLDRMEQVDLYLFVDDYIIHPLLWAG